VKFIAETARIIACFWPFTL